MREAHRERGSLRSGELLGWDLQLHYARAQELQPWLDRVAVRGEIVVQFWLKPGEAAVMLEKGEEREVERVPKQLRRFL